MIYASSSCIRQHNIADVIRQLAGAGISNIELSGGTDYYDGLEQEIQQLKQDYNLGYVCHAYFPPPKEPFVVNLASCNDRIYKQSIEHYENCIEMLKRLHCDVLSIHAGFMVEIGIDEIGCTLNDRIIYEEEKAYDRFCGAYEYIAGLCAAGGIALFLENNVLNAENYRQFHSENLFMMTDYRSIMKMKERIEFNLLLDLGHLYVSANTLYLDYAEECENLGGYVKWIHLSENGGIFDEHRPLEKDSPIMREFRKMYKPQTNITLETVGSVDEILNSIGITEQIISGKEGNYDGIGAVDMQ